MLDFAGAIDATCAHLEARGFVIERREEGSPNIRAVKDGRRLLIKLTGQTNPSGELFSDSQVKAHVARIVFDSLKLSETRAPSDEIWLVVPSDDGHRRRVTEVAGALRGLGVMVAWLSADGALSPFA